MASPIVIKVGGSTLGNADTSIGDIAAVSRARPVVVVHGGGKTTTDWIQRAGIATRFIDGLRVTDAASLDIVVAVLTGLVNKTLVGQFLAQGARAVGLAAADGGLVRVEPLNPALGFVGDVVGVDTGLVTTLLAGGFLPVIAPIAADADGQLYNVNADTIAAALARALDASEAMFLTDIAGVRGGDGSVVAELTSSEARRLIAEGVISGGMIPKVEAALACGVPARIVDGRQAGAIRQAISGGGGTRLIP